MKSGNRNMMTLDEFDKYLHDPSLMNKGFAAPVVIEHAKSLIHYVRELESKLKDADETVRTCGHCGKMETVFFKALERCELENVLGHIEVRLKIALIALSEMNEAMKAVAELKRIPPNMYWHENDHMPPCVGCIMEYAMNLADKTLAHHNTANMQSGDHIGCQCEKYHP